MKVLSVLAYRPFALLWSGQTLSRLGDSVYSIGLLWWTLQTTGSAVAVSAVLAAFYIPQVLFVLIGGVVVDRFSRVQLMLLSDLLSGSIVAVLVVLTVIGQVELWHVYVVSAGLGLVSAVFEPAYAAVMPELVPSDRLPAANALTSLNKQIINVVGPALGAALVTVGGPSTVFAINALTFFVSAASLLPLLALRSLHTPEAGEGRPLLDLQLGFKMVLASPWLWIGILVFALCNISHYSVRVVALPLLVKGSLQADVHTLGLVMGLFSLGAVLGAVWAGRICRLRYRGFGVHGTMLIGGLMTFLLGFPIGFLGVAIANLVTGITYTLSGMIWMNTLQELVPRNRLGRVFSIDMLGSFALLPVGYTTIGWGIDHLGAPAILRLGGLLSIAITALALVHPAIRQLD
jgi:MFS family permease